MPDNRNATADNGGESENIKASDLLLSSLPDGPDSGLRDARKRCGQIQLLLQSMTKQINKVFILLDAAKMRDDHLTLGYKSWTAYITGEYAGLLADLGRVERREVVGSLTAAGMSTRAIADVVGTSHKTVVKDLQVQVVPEVPPDLVDHQDGVDRHVTGLDGKSYAVPSRPVIEPRKPRRGSLPDDYWRALHDLDKVVRRLEKLHADDRFLAHRKALYGLHGAWLSDFDALVSSISADCGGYQKCECGGRILPNRDCETRCKACRGESG